MLPLEVRRGQGWCLLGLCGLLLGAKEIPHQVFPGDGLHAQQAFRRGSWPSVQRFGGWGAGVRSILQERVIEGEWYHPDPWLWEKCDMQNSNPEQPARSAGEEVGPPHLLLGYTDLTDQISGLVS